MARTVLQQVCKNFTGDSMSRMRYYYAHVVSSGMTMDSEDHNCFSSFSSATTILAPFSTTVFDGFVSPTPTLTTLTLIDVNNTAGQWCETSPMSLLRSSSSVTMLINFDPDCTYKTRLSSPTVVSSGSVMVPPTRVYWHSSDLSKFPSDYASSLKALMEIPLSDSSPVTSSATSTPTPPSTSKPSSRLGPGAQAGIGVGAGVAVVLGVLALLCLWRRRKRQHQQRTEHPGMSEVEGGSNGLMRFMGGKWRAETDGTSEPVEAEAKSVRVVPGPPAELADTNPGAKQ
jgi:hypothetical protein